MFACPNSPHDEPHIEALANAVSSGVRRRFTIIDRENMLQSVMTVTCDLSVWSMFMVIANRL